ncbi:hypothetical protein [Pseudomonas aeruginosa]|uniref:type II toxin-antitoxin system Phd/YefM family antitoxin n=1 Tax=Pseudomonas aeruginosa TaxID=287 RepID=UPI001A2747DA|nr:type II toxin-antitoxin system prevent-host-death family antitoxin [Pseudomonas aeruginosa]MDI3829430.1 hypothetical protein [Pseudomonas aeruginosa]HBN9565032.1 type II toxin-antitoxin system prevent-host-death family antitoxin [Pseudomonas aeruginosa]HBO3132162.1 type II toxin-antitoxin system prevent-host-death family antitoxin [Pseudomonas aeruginosa]HEH9254315.1 type II toxin-antitoxin system prevent-host-death family antitoxin [Pseudomonas aeruginosa]
MRSFDIAEVQARLDVQVDEAAEGNSFVITKTGVPMAKVVPLSADGKRPLKRLGFLAGQIQISDDCDYLGSADIDQLFN